MHNRASLILALAIAALSGWAIFSAFAWPLKAKLFPLVISIPLLCLALAEVVWVLLGSSGTAAADFKLSQEHPPEVARRRTLVAVAWIAGFFVLILLLGFLIAVPLLVFAYLRVQGKESWLFSAAFTLVLWAAFYGLFDQLLHLPFPPGWLFEWLGLA
jgi:Tripartite tricarboxylate transporter TctB family